MYTSDPVADFERYDYYKEKKLQKRPICAWCGEPIQDDVAIYLDNEWVCLDCINELKRSID